MTLKIYSILLFFSVFFTLSASGQENYTAGYVVLENGDTLQGNIDFRDWKKNPNQIEFISAEGGKFTYTPTEIKAFYADYEGGRLYESHRVKIDKTPHLSFRLNTSSVANTKEEVLFLLVYLKDTPLSLLFYLDQEGKEHFFIQQDKQVDELVNRKYKVNINGKEYIRKLNKYKGQLIHLTEDCEELKVSPHALQYKKKNILRLLKAYNRCKNQQSEPAYLLKRKNFTFETGLIAGVTFSHFNFMSESNTTLRDVSFDLQPSPAFGVILNAKLPYLQNSLSLYNELAYRPIVISGQYESTNYARDRQQTIKGSNYLYKAENLKSAHFLRWQQPGKGIQLFAQGGMWAHYNIRTTINERTFEYKRPHQQDYYKATTENWIEFPKFEYGFAAGFGGTYRKKLSGELRVEIDQGLGNFFPRISRTVAFGFFTTYMF